MTVLNYTCISHSVNISAPTNEQRQGLINLYTSVIHGGHLTAARWKPHRTPERTKVETQQTS